VGCSRRWFATTIRRLESADNDTTFGSRRGIAAPGPHAPQQNHLLEALSDIQLERILPALLLVPMPLGKVLYESDDVLRHVYFPIDCTSPCSM
jgi:hypothetical protein